MAKNQPRLNGSFDNSYFIFAEPQRLPENTYFLPKIQPDILGVAEIPGILREFVDLLSRRFDKEIYCPKALDFRELLHFAPYLHMIAISPDGSDISCIDWVDRTLINPRKRRKMPEPTDALKLDWAFGLIEQVRSVLFRENPEFRILPICSNGLSIRLHLLVVPMSRTGVRIDHGMVFSVAVSAEQEIGCDNFNLARLTQ